jgi:outer membrane PBP1 activator LpoA protein
MLSGLLAGAALAMLSACSTPCGEPGRLCAPAEPNTSADNAHPRAADLVRPAPAPLAAPAPSVQTMPVDNANAPAAPRGDAIRIGLMLPLRSGGLAEPAEAVRAGFMAAYERDRAGFVINVIETGDGAEDALDAYLAAVKDNDLIVGPLARPAVSMIASSGSVSKPTIALNHPDSGSGRIPPNMLVIGLSIEEEARQVAQWAAAEHPKTNALIVAGNSAWQRRLVDAFAARWRQLGNVSQLVEVPASGGYLHESGIAQVKARVEAEPPALVFVALDAGQLRQVRGALGTLPVYGTASINPGAEPGSAVAELDGVRLLDLPWQVQPDNPAVMVYPRRQGQGSSHDLDRLYALGIDAFRVARELALKPTSPFQMDGVSGRLAVDPAKGSLRFTRSETGVVYQNGAYRLADKKR